MARKTEYVDTSAFIAFLDRSDFHHPTFKTLFQDPPPLVTSALVVSEGFTWIMRRHDRWRALQFLAFCDELTVQIVGFDTDELQSATEVVKRYRDQDLTLADAHGLAIMSARKIAKCWSTDRHLTLAGAKLVIHQV